MDNQKIWEWVPSRNHDRPENWFCRHATRWIDDDGMRYKSDVVPIKYLTTTHLYNIINKMKNIYPTMRDDDPRRGQFINVVKEYNRRRGSIKRLKKGVNDAEDR